MQILDRKGVVTIRLTQEEGRRLRDASYIVNRISANLLSEEEALIEALDAAAKWIRAAADRFTPAKSQEKLDREDQQQM